MTWLLWLIGLLFAVPVVTCAVALGVAAHRNAMEFRRMSTDELHVLSQRR